MVNKDNHWISVKKLSKYCISILFYSLILVGASCEDEDFTEVYLEGKPIPGIEIFFPMGFYDAEPLMPKISPNGKKLLFTGPASLPDWKGLWVMDLSSQQKTLLHPNGRLGDWSPDGQWIVFNVGSGIYKIMNDASNLIELLPSDGYFEPDWSPNDVIYFGGNFGAGTINQDGSEQTFYEELGGHGDWHPSENKIVSSKDSGLRIFNLDLNNYNDIESVLADDFDRFPKYSSTGDKITFYNKNGIYIRDLIDNSFKRILPNQLYNSDYSPELYYAYPSWHPDGQHIVYEHFEITRSERGFNSTYVEGIIQFYKVPVDSAIAVSNLK